MIGLLIYWLANYAAGYAPYKIFFDRANKLERLIIPQVLGLIALPSLFLALNYLIGFEKALLATVAVAFAAALLVFLKVKNRTEDIAIGPHIFILIAAVASLVGLSLLSGSMYTISADLTFYKTATNSIINTHSFPPELTCFAGATYHYPWFFNLSIALQQLYSGLSEFLVYPVYTLYMAILFVATAYILGLKYSQNNTLATLFAAAMASYFFNSLQVTAPPSYVLPIIMLFFYAFSSFVKTPTAKTGILTGALAGSTIYVHGLSFGFVALVLFAYVLKKILFDTKNVVQIAYPLAGAAVALPYLLFIKSQTLSAFLFLPFSTALTFNYVSPFGFLVALFLLSVIKTNNSKESRLTLIYATALLFIFANIFVMKHSPNIDRFMIYMAIPMGLLALDWLGKVDKRIFIIVMIIAALIFIPPVIQLVHSFLLGQPTIETEKYNVSQWLMDNTKPGEIILASPSPFYSGLSERRQVICEPYFLLGWLYDPAQIKERFGDLLALYKEPSREFIEKYGIRHVVLGNQEKDFLSSYDITPYDFGTSKAFRLVYSTGTYKIYELIDASALPAKTKIPNFSNYSKWWAVT